MGMWKQEKHKILAENILESERISGGLHTSTGTMLIPSFKNNISLDKIYSVHTNKNTQ
jgi:hypothetical protein